MPERDLDVAEMPSLTPVSTMEPVDLVRADGGVPLTGRKARRGKLGVMGWLSISWLALVTLAAILAPILPIDDPNQVTASIARQPPGTDGHIFGGDGLGRDLFSRIIWGGRSSLLIGVMSVLLGLVLGGLLGLVAGYFRGRADGVLTGGVDVLLSFPQLILALSLFT